MADEYQNEFDYALPWWRSIVAHSERTKNVYMIKEESLDHLNEISQQLFSKLRTSMFWPILKDEPLIKNFLDCLRDIESQCMKEKNHGS